MLNQKEQNFNKQDQGDSSVPLGRMYFLLLFWGGVLFIFLHFYLPRLTTGGHKILDV